MEEDKRGVGWFINELLRLFRDMKPAEIDRIMELFKRNEELRLEGYGWKKIRVKCDNPDCRWEGRRIWGEKMFDKPCPKCDHSLSCPVRVVER